MSLTRVVSSSDEGHDVRSALTAGNPVGRAPGGHVSPAATSAASPSTKRRKPRRRVYVLDTSVLLADPSAITRFAEHDVVLPIVVVTELEAKRHHPELGWFARQALHLLDDLRIAHGRLDAPLVINELYTLIPGIKQRGIGILIVEQDIERSLAVADRFYCLLEGKVSLTGRPREVTRDLVIKHYFGL